ncbi:MspA family porin [Gordonia aurantiaca]|uniref:MspA family porin n=1 Tax=Gordonia sp. B21 TaxID=3151852 RepID=UPI003264DC90
MAPFGRCFGPRRRRGEHGEHERWISARVGARISPASGQTPRQPVNSVVLERFLVLGCQVDVSGGASIGFGSSIGANANVTISGVPGLTGFRGKCPGGRTRMRRSTVGGKPRQPTSVVPPSEPRPGWGRRR